MKTFLIMVLFVGAILSGCHKNPNPNPYPNQNVLVRITMNTIHGNILTDKDSRSLYFFANDANGQSSCTGGCEAVWPAFKPDTLKPGNLDKGLELKDFSTTTTSSGKKQLTYKGWPLYYYSPAIEGGVNEPEKPGRVTGDGVNQIWFVAKPDYSIMMANAQLVGGDGKHYRSDYTEGDEKTEYFTNASGITLYRFTRDSLNKNKFTKPDFSNNAIWPIYETDKVNVPSILDKTKFGSISVFGKKQLTYKGWPLYFFGADNGVRGSNKGVSAGTPGLWPVATDRVPGAPYPGQPK